MMAKRTARAKIEAQNGEPAHGFGAILVFEQLRDEILSMELRPGQLIDETNLAERFKVSRSPVREALVRHAKPQKSWAMPIEKYALPVPYREPIDSAAANAFVERSTALAGSMNAYAVDALCSAELYALGPRRCALAIPSSHSSAASCFSPQIESTAPSAGRISTLSVGS